MNGHRSGEQNLITQVGASTVWQALEHAPDAVVICDASGSIRYANLQSEKLFGHERSALMGSPLELLVPQRFTGTHIVNRDRYLSSPSTRPMGVGLQLTALHRDGREVPVEISLSPVEGDHEPFVIAVCRDVTEQRERQRVTLETLALLDNTHDATLVFSAPDTCFTYVNRGATRQTGLSRQELLRLRPVDLAPALDVAALNALLEPLRSGTKDLVEIQTRMVRSDGRDFPVEAAVQLVESEAAEASFVAVVRDVSERQLFMEQIAAQRDHLMMVVDALQDGLVEVDVASGAVVQVNERFCDMVGYTAAELLALGHDRPWAPDGDDLGLRARVAVETNARFESTLRHRSGRRFPVAVSTSRLRASAEQPTVVSVFHDLTEERAAAATLADAKSRLAIAEERDRIARDLHDTVIQRLFATGLTLQAALGRGDAEPRIERAVTGIDDAIRDLRTSIFTLRRPVDSMGVGDSVRVTAEEARRMLDCPLLVDVSPEVDLEVPLALRDELVAVVRESLTNVVKHAAARSVGLALDVEVGVLKVRIDDDGRGFDVASAVGGHGLRNLRDRAERLGGTCVISSSPGAGTHIVWSLPLDS